MSQTIFVDFKKNTCFIQTVPTTGVSVPGGGLVLGIIALTAVAMTTS